jgi:vacuolar-type H+-ATPase subunit I/STV1
MRTARKSQLTGNPFSAQIRMYNDAEPLAGPELLERSESVVWIRGIAGVVFCALGAVWIAQGSGAMHGVGMWGHAPFALPGGAAVIVGLALLVWAARIRRRQTDT